MGQFSWFTNDGVRLLDDRRLLKPVFMTGEMPDGRVVTFREDCVYEGYGKFGGKDYYEFMAEMNGFTADDFNGDKDKLRSKGIRLAFSSDPCGEKSAYKYPSLSLDGKWYGGISPKTDPEQGWGVTRQDVGSGLYELDDSDIDDCDIDESCDE